jgi:glycosyltransferase involved in cell wall biosynthesis
MDIRPDVSVVMGVHNGGTRLRGSLESILAQDKMSLELIVVNDGSQDDTGTILDEYARCDRRVTIVSQPHGGLTKALAAGCSLARADYIARQDSGDVSLPGRLVIQKETLDATPELSFVSCWTEFKGPASETLFVNMGSGGARTPTLILNAGQRWGVIDGPTHHGSVMFRRIAYVRAGGYRDAFYFGQDWDLWYRLAEIGHFQVVGRVLYRATLDPGISSRQRKAQRAAARLSMEALRLRMRGLSDDLVLERARQIGPASEGQSRKQSADYLYFVGECLRRRGDKRAREYFRRAVASDRLAWRAWIRLAQMNVSGGRSSSEVSRAGHR